MPTATATEIENAAVAIKIIEDTAKLSGLLAKSVMETTKDEQLVVKLIETAVLKAEKQLVAIGFDSGDDLAKSLEMIRECLSPWGVGDELHAEQVIEEYFAAARDQAEQIEEDAPSYSEEMRREHGTHYGL